MTKAFTKQDVISFIEGRLKIANEIIDSRETNSALLFKVENAVLGLKKTLEALTKKHTNKFVKRFQVLNSVDGNNKFLCVGGDRSGFDLIRLNNEENGFEEGLKGLGYTLYMYNDDFSPKHNAVRF